MRVHDLDDVPVVPKPFYFPPVPRFWLQFRAKYIRVPACFDRSGWDWFYINHGVTQRCQAGQVIAWMPGHVSLEQTGVTCHDGKGGAGKGRYRTGGFPCGP